ncbi:MAG: YggS family pyridoxal phosphate-dependent enzyme [Pyrinomonadaceae bacterium]
MVSVENDLQTRLDSVRARIAACVQRSNRAPEEITLVAVSKTHPPQLLREAIGIGVTDLGENRVQEAGPKIAEVGRSAARWHLIGHLQTNKARKAISLFDVIHSLDSISLARRLEQASIDEGREELRVLIQVDLAGEATKSGIVPEKLLDLVEVVNDCSRLKFAGLMVLPPFFEDRERVRPFFRRLKELRDELQLKRYFGVERGELSMGMTHDFEVAIEEGATMLRIGTAIFGEHEVGRPPK